MIHREPRASLGLNFVTGMVLRAAALPRRTGTNAMQQQWPDPETAPPQQPIQTPPETPQVEPQAPQAPQPDDGDNGDAEA